MTRVIFLLGAGASIDAGLPSVVQLTNGLRQRLSTLRDATGNTRAEFLSLFEAIARHDGEVTKNYERFFEWLSLIRQGQKAPYNKLVRFDLESGLARAASELPWHINEPIFEMLREGHLSRQYAPDYLGCLADFLSEKGRLKVFTLNYDLCVEDASARRDIDVVTGFRPNDGRWAPSLFNVSTRGINLYKLHGSLNWTMNTGDTHYQIVENRPPKWDHAPELLLGPGSKLQYDEPFVTLYSGFHRALRRARVCVVVGYSFRDDHIKEPLRDASRRGLTVVDVNPVNLETGFDRYRGIPLGAKKAFENGTILDEVSKLLSKSPRAVN